MSLEEQKRLIRNEVKQKLMRLPMSWVQEEAILFRKRSWKAEHTVKLKRYAVMSALGKKFRLF